MGFYEDIVQGVRTTEGIEKDDLRSIEDAILAGIEADIVSQHTSDSAEYGGNDGAPEPVVTISKQHSRQHTQS